MVFSCPSSIYVLRSDEADQNGLIMPWTFPVFAGCIVHLVGFVSIMRPHVLIQEVLSDGVQI